MVSACTPMKTTRPRTRMASPTRGSHGRANALQHVPLTLSESPAGQPFEPDGGAGAAALPSAAREIGAAVDHFDLGDAVFPVAYGDLRVDAAIGAETFHDEAHGIGQGEVVGVLVGADLAV